MSYAPGDTVQFDVSSWSMSTQSDVRDTELTVSLDGEVLGSFPVETTLSTAGYDEVGTASVSVTLPAGTEVGSAVLTLTGAETGTEVLVPVEVSAVDHPSTNGKAKGHDKDKAKGEAKGHHKVRGPAHALAV
jgi:5'-nucleotidase